MIKFYFLCREYYNNPRCVLRKRERETKHYQNLYFVLFSKWVRNHGKPLYHRRRSCYHSIPLIATANAISTTITTATVMRTSVSPPRSHFDEPAGPGRSTNPARLLLVAMHCHRITSPHPPPWWLHYHIPPSFFFFSGGMLNVSFIFVWSWIVSIFSILLISFYDHNFSDNQAGGQRCWSFPPIFSEFLIVLFFFQSQKYYSSRLQTFSVSAAVFMATDSCRHLQIASTLCLGTPPPLLSFPQVWDQWTWVVDCCLFFCLVAGVINLTKTCLQCFGPQLLPPTATAAHQHHPRQLTLASNK